MFVPIGFKGCCFFPSAGVWVPPSFPQAPPQKAHQTIEPGPPEMLGKFPEQAPSGPACGKSPFYNGTEPLGTDFRGSSIPTTSSTETQSPKCRISLLLGGLGFGPPIVPHPCRVNITQRNASSGGLRIGNLPRPSSPRKPMEGNTKKHNKSSLLGKTGLPPYLVGWMTKAGNSTAPGRPN